MPFCTLNNNNILIPYLSSDYTIITVNSIPADVNSNSESVLKTVLNAIFQDFLCKTLDNHEIWFKEDNQSFFEIQIFLYKT